MPRIIPLLRHLPVRASSQLHVGVSIADETRRWCPRCRAPAQRDGARAGRGRGTQLHHTRHAYRAPPAMHPRKGGKRDLLYSGHERSGGPLVSRRARGGLSVAGSCSCSSQAPRGRRQHGNLHPCWVGSSGTGSDTAACRLPPPDGTDMNQYYYEHLNLWGRPALRVRLSSTNPGFQLQAELQSYRRGPTLPPSSHRDLIGPAASTILWAAAVLLPGAYTVVPVTGHRVPASCSAGVSAKLPLTLTS